MTSTNGRHTLAQCMSAPAIFLIGRQAHFGNVRCGVTSWTRRHSEHGRTEGLVTAGQSTLCCGEKQLECGKCKQLSVVDFSLLKSLRLPRFAEDEGGVGECGVIGPRGCFRFC